MKFNLGNVTQTTILLLVLVCSHINTYANNSKIVSTRWEFKPGDLINIEDTTGSKWELNLRQILVDEMSKYITQIDMEGNERWPIETILNVNEASLIRDGFLSKIMINAEITVTFEHSDIAMNNLCSKSTQFESDLSYTDDMPSELARDILKFVYECIYSTQNQHPGISYFLSQTRFAAFTSKTITSEDISKYFSFGYFVDVKKLDKTDDGYIFVSLMKGGFLERLGFRDGMKISFDDVNSLKEEQLPKSNLAFTFLRYMAFNTSELDSLLNRISDKNIPIQLTNHIIESVFLQSALKRDVSLINRILTKDVNWEHFGHKIHPLDRLFEIIQNSNTQDSAYLYSVANEDWTIASNKRPVAIFQHAIMTSNKGLVERTIALNSEPVHVLDVLEALGSDYNVRMDIIELLASKAALNELISYSNPLSNNSRGTILHAIQPTMTIYSLKSEGSFDQSDVIEKTYGMPTERVKSLASLLIGLGADPSVQNSFGRTPSDEYMALQQLSQESRDYTDNKLQQNLHMREIALAQRKQELARWKAEEDARRKAEEENSFNWAKAAALTAGVVAAAAGGDVKLDSVAQAEILTGIVSDSLPGAGVGASNTLSAISGSGARMTQEMAANNPYSNTTSNTNSYGTAKSNQLGSSAGCVSDSDIQLASMCKTAQVYYDRYVLLHNSNGPDYASDMYSAHMVAAQNALNLKSDFSSNNTEALQPQINTSLDQFCGYGSRQAQMVAQANGTYVDCKRVSNNTKIIMNIPSVGLNPQIAPKGQTQRNSVPESKFLTGCLDSTSASNVDYVYKNPSDSLCNPSQADPSGSGDYPNTSGINNPSGGFNAPSPAGTTHSNSGGTNYPGGSFSDVAGSSSSPSNDKRKSVKYVYIKNIKVDKTGSSAYEFSEQKLIKELTTGTKAKNAMNDACKSNYRGSFGQDWIREHQLFDIRSKKSGSITKWHGHSRVGGYCRLFSHNAGYDSVPWCSPQIRRKTGCAISSPD